MTPLLGIFVGGAARRMGGAPKGLLPAPDGSGPLVSRLATLGRTLGLEVVLVGDRGEYTTLDLPIVRDVAPGKGPLGGLVALLERADGRDVLALACDLPRLDVALLARLLEAEGTTAPKRDGRWEPLTARYAARALPLARARLDRGDLSLQALLDEAGARELSLDEAEARMLVDWDRPEDIG